MMHRPTKDISKRFNSPLSIRIFSSLLLCCYILISHILFCSFLSFFCTSGLSGKNKGAAIENYSIQSTHESDQPKRNPRRRRDDNLEIYERRQSRKEENKNLKKNIVVLYNLVKPEESIKSNILIMFFIFCFIFLGFKQFHK